MGKEKKRKEMKEEAVVNEAQMPESEDSSLSGVRAVEVNKASLGTNSVKIQFLKLVWVSERKCL